MRHIYILHIPEFDYYKIGFSNNPQMRYANISTNIPFDLNIIFTAKNDRASQIESKLHYKYREYRIKGEWFKLSMDHIMECMYLIFCEQKIFILKGLEYPENYYINGDFYKERIKKIDTTWIDGFMSDFIFGKVLENHIG